MIVLTGVDVNRNTVYTNNPWGIYGEQKFDDFVDTFSGGSKNEYELSKIYTVRR